MVLPLVFWLNPAQGNLPLWSTFSHMVMLFARTSTWFFPVMVMGLLLLQFPITGPTEMQRTWVSLSQIFLRHCVRSVLCICYARCHRKIRCGSAHCMALPLHPCFLVTACITWQTGKFLCIATCYRSVLRSSVSFLQAFQSGHCMFPGLSRGSRKYTSAFAEIWKGCQIDSLRSCRPLIHAHLPAFVRALHY